MKKCRRLARVAVAVTALQFAASTVWADTCASAAEKTAFDTRVLQSELMVAALSCGENARYNSFVQKFESELVANGNALRGYFARNYGKSGEDVLDRFITRIANNAASSPDAAADAAILRVRGDPVHLGSRLRYLRLAQPRQPADVLGRSRGFCLHRSGLPRPNQLKHDLVSSNRLRCAFGAAIRQTRRESKRSPLVPVSRFSCPRRKIPPAQPVPTDKIMPWIIELKRGSDRSRLTRVRQRALVAAVFRPSRPLLRAAQPGKSSEIPSKEKGRRIAAAPWLLAFPPLVIGSE